MRFKQFIIEQIQLNVAESENNFIIKRLNDDEWVDWVLQYCSNYLPRADNYPIYRGIIRDKNTKLGFKDTNEFTRQSASLTPNYYTLWMDNAPQWKDYPKRSKSFIGSSNFNVAQKFGTVYQLFPADDAKIGICPKDDIWDSFGEMPGGDLSDFAFLLKKAFKKIYGEAAAELATINWTKLKLLLELTSFDQFLKVNKIDTTHVHFTQKYPSLFVYFKEEIVPWKHGFQHTTPANYSLTGADEREVWVQGKVALIDTDIILNPNLNRHLFPETLKLLSQYKIEKPFQ